MRRKRLVFHIGAEDAAPVQARGTPTATGLGPAFAGIYVVDLERAGYAMGDVARGAPLWCRGSRWFVRNAVNPGGRNEVLELELVRRDPNEPPEIVDEGSIEDLFETEGKAEPNGGEEESESDLEAGRRNRDWG